MTKVDKLAGAKSDFDGFLELWAVKLNAIWGVGVALLRTQTRMSQKQKE